MFNIKFNQTQSQFLYHTRYEDIAKKIFKDLSFLENHFLLFSSGTTSSAPKGYAVSEESLFNNAKAVNEFFNLTPNDVWGLTLPPYHIGGLSVIARAHLLGSRLVNLNGKWNPEQWAKTLQEEKVTITTVVPTQIYDLVKNNIPAPPELRFIIVGGDFLSSALSESAIKLGWPIVKTFGMTEVCSQLASAKSSENDDLLLLPIHEIKTDQEQRLWVKSQSLYTLEFVFENKETITSTASSRLDDQGFFPTSDRVLWSENRLTHLGRLDDQIKINGRLTSLNALKDILYNYALSHDLYGHLELKLKSDERSGKIIEILFDQPIKQDEISLLFSPVSPHFCEVSQFDRTDLGKLKK